MVRSELLLAIHMEGFMKKKRRLNLGLKGRYYVLNGGILRQYKTRSDVEKENCEVEYQVSSVFDWHLERHLIQKKERFVYGMRLEVFIAGDHGNLQHETLYVSCETMDEKERWVRCIRAACDETSEEAEEILAIARERDNRKQIEEEFTLEQAKEKRREENVDELTNIKEKEKERKRRKRKEEKRRRIEKEEKERIKQEEEKKRKEEEEKAKEKEKEKELERKARQRAKKKKNKEKKQARTTPPPSTTDEGSTPSDDNETKKKTKADRKTIKRKEKEKRKKNKETQENNGVWSAHTSPDGRIYYFNHETNTSTWEKPIEFQQEDTKGQENELNEICEEKDEIEEEYSTLNRIRQLRENRRQTIVEDPFLNEIQDNIHEKQAQIQKRKQQKEKEERLRQEKLEEALEREREQKLIEEAKARARAASAEAEEERLRIKREEKLKQKEKRRMEKLEKIRKDTINESIYEENDSIDEADIKRRVSVEESIHVIEEQFKKIEMDKLQKEKEEYSSDEENQILEKANVWTSHFAPDGRTYYYNEKTEKSVWKKPKIMKKAERIKQKIKQYQQEQENEQENDKGIQLGVKNPLVKKKKEQEHALIPYSLNDLSILIPPSLQTKENVEICFQCCQRKPELRCLECFHVYCSVCSAQIHQALDKQTHTLALLTVPFCIVCEANSATQYCKECQMNCCDECSSYLHRKSPKTLHTRLPVPIRKDIQDPESKNQIKQEISSTLTQDSRNHAIIPIQNSSIPLNPDESSISLVLQRIGYFCQNGWITENEKGKLKDLLLLGRQDILGAINNNDLNYLKHILTVENQHNQQSHTIHPGYPIHPIQRIGNEVHSGNVVHHGYPGNSVNPIPLIQQPLYPPCQQCHGWGKDFIVQNSLCLRCWRAKKITENWPKCQQCHGFGLGLLIGTTGYCGHCLRQRERKVQEKKQVNKVLKKPITTAMTTSGLQELSKWDSDSESDLDQKQNIIQRKDSFEWDSD